MDSKSSSDTYASSNTPCEQRSVNFDDDNVVLLQSKHFSSGESVEPNVKLLPLPFLAIVLASNGALIGFMAIFLSEKKIGFVSDSVGSSENADKMVDSYQMMNGYISAAAVELLKIVFSVFIVVIITYFGNLPWYPGQNPREGRGKGKRIVLWWFTPFMLFVTTVGITAINIKSEIVGVKHVFVRNDLATSTHSINDTNRTDDAQNTILRSAVRSEVSPFSINLNSKCLLSNTSVNSYGFKRKTTQASEMPTIKDIDSLAAEYGFTSNRWNRDALPFALEPRYSVNFTEENLALDEFAAFQKDTGFDFLTGYEMFLQGKTLFERAVSDGNVSAEYPCSWVDGLYDNDTEEQVDFDTFDNTSKYHGMRKCNGAVSSLRSLSNIADPSTHNLKSFVKTIMDGMNLTLNQTTKISTAETKFRLETYSISRQMNVTMMTVDIPLHESVQYQNTSENCADGSFIDGENLYTKAQLSQMNKQYCSSAYYVFNQPAATCGARNCIFLDESGATPFKKQILLLPYLKDCSVVNMTYGSDYLNFLPHGCAAQNDSVFLYGSGTYLSGDAFKFNLEEDAFPYISKPRRHFVFSFAKLDWRMEDVSKMFNTRCGVVGGCSGMVHKLPNETPKSKPVLVVGNSTIPAERMTARFINPVQLVTLTAPPLFYPKTNKRHLWEYLDFGRFSTNSWASNLTVVNCSVLVDSYITQVERNHYYLDDPRQAMYSAAVYYLFQDAATKNVTITKLSTDEDSFYLGSSRFAGDKEMKMIRYSIPMNSFIATFVGIAIVIILSFIVVVTPIDRVKISQEKNFAARYADLLTKEKYPTEVHNRKLLLPNGELVLMDECIVENITLHSVNEESNKVFM